MKAILVAMSCAMLALVTGLAGDRAEAATYVLINPVPDSDVTYVAAGIYSVFSVSTPEPSMTLFPGDTLEIQNLFVTPIYAPRTADYFWDNDGSLNGGQNRMLNTHHVIFAGSGIVLGVADRFEYSGPIDEGVTVGGFFRSNISATPEPSAWALMLLGLGATGTLLRRRRAAVA